MSTKNIVNADVRTDQGKGASRRLRRDGKLPAIVYGGGDESVSLTLDHNQMIQNAETESFYSQILTLNVEDKSMQVIVRDLHRHPYKRLLMHIDFMRVKADELIQISVPLHYMGEEDCVGVKLGGGIINHVETEVLVSCLPKDLPEFIEVDLSELNVGESVHLSDVIFPEGVTSVDLSHGEDHDKGLASVHLARTSTDDDDSDAAETTEDAADGDVSDKEDA